MLIVSALAIAITSQSPMKPSPDTVLKNLGLPTSSQVSKEFGGKSTVVEMSWANVRNLKPRRVFRYRLTYAQKLDLEISICKRWPGEVNALSEAIALNFVPGTKYDDNDFKYKYIKSKSKWIFVAVRQSAYKNVDGEFNRIESLLTK